MRCKYPADDPAAGYEVPKKHVLLLSCIDLRLTDDLARFMESDNLTNRYDHFILAGASLGPYLKNCEPWRKHPRNPHLIRMFAGWDRTLEQHINIAIDLHAIRDVYIVEHENCGAYKESVDPAVLTSKSEFGCQCTSSLALATRIENHFKCAGEYLKAHRFRMNLRGQVRWLGPNYR